MEKFQEKFNSIIRITGNEGKLRSTSIVFRRARRRAEKKRIIRSPVLMRDDFFEKIFDFHLAVRIFARIREEKKKKREGKKINARDELFVFTLRTDHFSVPLSIVGLIISPLFTRNYSLVAKRIENQFCNAR